MHCTHCDYNLRGLSASGHCPECGSRFFQTPLDETEAAKLAETRRAVLRLCPGLGVLITPPALLAIYVLLSFSSVDPRVLACIYPYSAILLQVGGGLLLPPALLIALTQFPLYGLLLGRVLVYRGRTRVALLMACLAGQFAAAVACVLGA